MALDWAPGMPFRRDGMPHLRRGLPPLTPTRKTAVVGVVGLSAALALAWFAVLLPRGHEVSKVDAQVATVAAGNDSLRNQIAARHEQEAQLPQLRKLSQALDSRFPPTAEQAKLFRMITAAAASAGIAPQYLTNLNVDAPVDSSQGAGDTAHLPGVGAAIGQIASQRVSMDARGTPAQIRNFIANLERLPRAFEVTTVTLTKPAPALGVPASGGIAAPPAAPDANFQTATITGQMFLMPPVSDPTADATNTTGAGRSTPPGAAATAPQ